MMNLEILKEFPGSNNDQTIVKRKRTKRLRPSASSTSSTGGGCSASTAGELSHNSLVSSCPTTSSGETSTTSTEEDEDMANCLILLARGHDPQKVMPPEKKKVSSRKFTEMATTTAEGRIGIYVYECKTCSRTFPSFQALGGHRASYKKTKTTTEDDRKISPAAVAQPGNESTKLKPIISPPPNKVSSPKIHECSICGLEFGSGQALGGHMRRHRSVVNNSNVTTNDHDGESTRSISALDLNLPAQAPEEDRGREDASFRQFSVLSTAALADCHY